VPSTGNRYAEGLLRCVMSYGVRPLVFGHIGESTRAVVGSERILAVLDSSAFPMTVMLHGELIHFRPVIRCHAQRWIENRPVCSVRDIYFRPPDSRWFFGESLYSYRHRNRHGARQEIRGGGQIFVSGFPSSAFQRRSSFSKAVAFPMTIGLIKNRYVAAPSSSTKAMREGGIRVKAQSPARCAGWQAGW